MQRTHLIIIVLFVFFIGCNQATKKQKNANKNVFLQKIDRPFVAGNFDKKGINDTISSFSCIPGYLEKKNDIWMYNEYDVKKGNKNSIKVLRLNKCNF